MKNKLTLNEEIETFLNSDKRELWGAVTTNDTEKISSIIADDKEDILNQITSELFANNKSDILDQKDFKSIKEGDCTLLHDLVKLVFALDINGEREELRLYIGEKLFDIAIPNMVQTIKEEAKKYPKHLMNPILWAESIEMRSTLNALIFYYKLKDNIDALHFLIMNRTQLTLSIMDHYKHLVGSDLFESAQIKEQIGDKDTALSFYRMVEKHLLNELSWFVSSPESGPNEEDTIILKALKEALIAIDRLSNTEDYLTMCSQIDEVLERESFEVPNFDDDDDDE